MELKLKYFLFLPFCLGLVISSFGLPNKDSTYIKVNFKYGSKPGKKNKKTESKYFGGLHGGHVTVEIGDSIYGFSPALPGARILAKKSQSNGNFHLEEEYKFSFDSTGNKLLSIKIPILTSDFIKLRQQVKKFLAQTPYDYALFGMRCAASAHQMLSYAGIFNQRSKLSIILRTFYPKKLRKRLLDMAFENKYEITYQEGKKERKWEKDKRRHRKKL